MTFLSGITLFFAMLVSALIPGPSVMTVVSRSMSSGFRQGILLTLGVLFADYVFICIALTGLNAISTVLGELASYLKYIGATYIFWLAFQAWKADAPSSNSSRPRLKSKFTSILTGLCVGISNPKAILFYMGFFPMFIQINQVDLIQTIIILMISTLSVGGVLSMYAYVASKTHSLAMANKQQFFNRLSGAILATCSAILAFNA